MLTNDEFTIQFPTIFEYSNSYTNAKQQNECGQYFSKNKIFINNGDTFNGKYIIEYFQKTSNVDDTNYTNDINNYNTTKLHKIISEIYNHSTLIENINIISSIGLLTKKQYNNFLDKPSTTKKMHYLSNHYNQCSTFFKPHLMPFKQIKIKQDKTKKDLFSCKIITTLFNENFNITHNHLKKCIILKNNNVKTNMLATLMQCSITIFDITNESERELQQAQIAFNYIYNELIKYSDEEIIRTKENGIIRKFILISTVATWLKDTSNHSINSEHEETNIDIIQKNILERLPKTKYQIIFEFEKLILKSNSSKIKDIFKTHIISTGVIYGHEENALRYVFNNAWNNPKEMYILMLNRKVPVFHVDELAKLIFIISKHNNNIKNNYILAVEHESYGFNNILKSLCDELCSSCLVSKDDYIIKNQYKFNSFTWDLICGNLIINPMLDIVIPDYPIQRKTIISNMNKLTREFIKGTNLKAVKLIITGQSTHVTSNIAENLAQYYQVQLINIPNLITKHLKTIINIQNELMLKMYNLNEQRTKIIHSLSKLTDQSKNKWLDPDDRFTREGYFSDEQINDENMIMDERNYNFEMYDKSNKMSVSDIFLEPSETSFNITSAKDDKYIQNSVHKLYFMKNKKENDLLDIDNEIDIIEKKLHNLNDRYKEYENYKRPLNLDNHLLLLIKESLTSFSCHNQGYIFNIFPLSVKQIEYIFNDDIVYPNFIILLLNRNISKFCERKEITLSTINESERYKLDHNSIYSINSKYQKLDTYEHNVDYKNSKSQTSITDIHDTFKNKTGKYTYVNNDYETYDAASKNDNNLVDYFTKIGINTLRFTVPVELADKTRSYKIQYEAFTDAIITRIGNSPITIINKIYPNETIMNTTRQRTSKNKINKVIINEKCKKTLNKLNTMKQQWNKEILKTKELKKILEYNKSVKIHNFLNTSILPKLLKEISLNDNKNTLVSQFPEKTLNKTILCGMQTEEK